MLGLYSEPELQETCLPLELIYFTLCSFHIFRFFLTVQVLQDSYYEIAFLRSEQDIPQIEV